MKPMIAKPSDHTGPAAWTTSRCAAFRLPPCTFRGGDSKPDHEEGPRRREAHSSAPLRNWNGAGARSAACCGVVAGPLQSVDSYQATAPRPRSDHVARLALEAWRSGIAEGGTDRAFPVGPADARLRASTRPPAA
jgi:hypothetical protein